MDNQTNVGPCSSSLRETVRKRTAFCALTCALLTACPAFADPGPGQSDTFEDGTTMGWRINLLYFDGHAANVDEVEAINPSIWLPSKAVIPAGTDKLWPDVQAKYVPQLPFTIP